MESVRILVVLCVVICSGLAQQSAPDTLRQVHVMFRHGDRTPLEYFPSDPHKDSFAQGVGQLTNKGKNMHFNFGKQMRERYTGFLNKTYHPDSVKARSTNVDRTLMSAYCHLAGLFEPEGDQIWKEDLKWQPIPVHTVKRETDYLLDTKSPCPRLDELRAEVFGQDKIKKENEEFQPLFAFLEEKTGMPIPKIEIADDVWDTLFVESQYNKTWPDWVTDELWVNLTRAHDRNFEWKYVHREQQKLRGGPWLKDVLEHLDQSVEGKDKRDYYLYAGHDTSIMAVLFALDLYDQVDRIVPGYASSIIVELHKIDNQDRVQFYYRNDTHAPFPLTPKGCDNHSCPLTKLKELTADIMPGDIRKDCKA